MVSKTMFLTVSLALANPAFSSPIALPDDAGKTEESKPKPAVPVPVAIVPVHVPAPDSAPGKPESEPRKPWPRTNDVVAARQAPAVPPATPPMPSAEQAAAPAPNSLNAGFAMTTQNGVLDKKSCADMTVIFARGTTETGNVGSSAGPPFFEALAQEMGAGSIAVQGVDYPADIPGFLAGGSPDGSKTMAELVQKAMSQCPNSKIVVSGYSQGGQLVHNAAKILPADVMSRVAGAVIFGDPDDGQAVQGLSEAKTKVICHDGDLICAGTAAVLPPHLTYSMNAGEAAKFAASL